MIPSLVFNQGGYVPLLKRKSENSCDLGNIIPSKMAGPNGGTSFDRVTAMLEG